MTNDISRIVVPVARLAVLAVGVPTVQFAQLIGDSQSRLVVDARHLTAYLLRQEAGWSLPRIGRALHRDHSTVLYAVRRIERLAAEDENFAMTLVWAMEEARRVVGQGGEGRTAA